MAMPDAVNRLESALPFLPIDRIQDLLGIRPLASEGCGAVLFADLSGFTALSRGLVEAHGPRRGAERATQTLNEILEELLAPIHGWGGSVLSFNGDGFLCWFPTGERTRTQVEPCHDAIFATAHCACAMQAVMLRLQTAQAAHTIGLKIGIAGGYAHRFIVGEPEIQVLDALAGAPVALAVAGESHAAAGEILIEESTFQTLVASSDGKFAVREWREYPALQTRFGVLDPLSEYNAPPYADRAEEVQHAGRRLLAEGAVRPWLPPFVWERLEAGRGAFLAELRPAVAVFARFAVEQMGQDGPSRRALRAYIAWAQRVFDSMGGAVIQVTLGDKGSYLYGVLGAPAQHDDTAQRAAEVARRLATGPGNHEHEPGARAYEGDFRSRAQVGLAQGRMRTGAYGSRTRRTYGVQGNAVNLAARLMMLAQPGEVLLEPAAATLLEAYYHLVPLSPAELRGYAAPVSVFQLGERIADTSLAVGFESRFAHERLIKRVEPMAQLLDAFNRAQAGASVVLHVVGEAGVGKSALLWQFADHGPLDVLTFDCRATATGSGYGLVIRLLGQLLNVAPGPDDAVQRDGVQGDTGHWNAVQWDTLQWDTVVERLRARGVDGGAPIAVLAEASGREAAAETAALAEGLTLAQRRELLAGLLFVALRSVRSNHAEEKNKNLAGNQVENVPSVVLLDDLHMADPASRAVLVRLFEWLTEPLTDSVVDPLAGEREMRAQPGVLFVTTQRDMQQDSWSPEASADLPGDTLSLPGLNPDEGRELLTQELHGAPDSLTLDLLTRYSQGNPLYLTLLAEELVSRGDLHQADFEEPDATENTAPPLPEWQVAGDIFARLQTAGCLQRVDGEWRLRVDAALGAADLGLPDTLHRLVLVQIDRLPISVGLTLKVVAVANTGIAESLIGHAHPNSPDASIVRDLEMLSIQGLVRIEIGETGYSSYRIANSVVHDVVYESLLDRQRKELHHALAEGYETLIPQPVELVAYHLFRSDVADALVREKACTALEQAVELARQRYALEAALGFLDCLLSLAPQWKHLRVKFELLHALGLRREQSTWLDTMEQALDAPAAELALCRACYFEAVGDYDAAESSIARALEVALAADDVPQQATAYCLLGQVARRRGDHGAAQKHYLDALAAIDANRNADRYGEIAYGLGIAARHQGDFPEARRRLDDAFAFFRQRVARPDEALVLTALGVLAQMERHYDNAYACHEQALAIRRAINDWPGEGASLVSMAQLRRAQGFHADAIRLLEAARHIHRSLRDRWWENRILNEIGVIYLIAGMLPAAKEAIEAGIELAQSIGDAAGEMVLLLNLGQVLRDLGEHDTAARVLRQSLEMARARGEKYVEAQCESDLARAYLLTQRCERAIDTAQQAIELLVSLGLESATTADLATQAQAYLRLEKVHEALACARQIVDLLDAVAGEGADFPQRDYWVAFTVFQAAGRTDQAEHALSQSRAHLQKMSAGFQDPEMRTAFLNNIAVNRAIQGL